MVRYVDAEFPAADQRDTRWREVFREFRTIRETADYAPETPSADDIKELLTDAQLIRDHFIKAAGE